MKQYLILQRYIEGLTKGFNHSLIVVGQAGIGKTEMAFETLKEKGLEENHNFKYLANFITPKGFVELLKEVNELKDPKLLILDDVENTLKNPQIAGILKGALWSAGGNRRVMWKTNKENINFNFEGRIIMLLNHFNSKSHFWQAVKDRGAFYEMEMSKQEMLKLMEERSKTSYPEIPLDKKQKIVNYITKVAYNKDNFSLRLLPKAIGYYKTSPNHWQELIGKEL